ncbi:hypothetical protein DFH28DRAFT_920911 [Melampsora americana]|nr:hypothetical protein DFH28DRAFT_920911 [Melampsora americana]
MQSNTIDQSRSTSPNSIQSTSHTRFTSASTPIRSTSAKSTTSQNDEGCFVEPPFPSPMPNQSHHLKSISTDSTEELSNEFHQTKEPYSNLIQHPSSYPIQRLLTFEDHHPKKKEPIEIKIDFISQLPIELGLYIILKINEIQSMIKCREVSKHWKKAI